MGRVVSANVIPNFGDGQAPGTQDGRTQPPVPAGVVANFACGRPCFAVGRSSVLQLIVEASMSGQGHLPFERHCLSK